MTIKPAKASTARSEDIAISFWVEQAQWCRVGRHIFINSYVFGGMQGECCGPGGYAFFATMDLGGLGSMNAI